MSYVHAPRQCCRGSQVMPPESAEDLVSDLVVEFAPVIMRALTAGDPVSSAQLRVILRATMLAYRFDHEQAQEFVQILVREI